MSAFLKDPLGYWNRVQENRRQIGWLKKSLKSDKVVTLHDFARAASPLPMDSDNRLLIQRRFEDIYPSLVMILELKRLMAPQSKQTLPKTKADPVSVQNEEELRPKFAALAKPHFEDGKTPINFVVRYGDPHGYDTAGKVKAGMDDYLAPVLNGEFLDAKSDFMYLLNLGMVMQMLRADEKGLGRAQAFGTFMSQDAGQEVVDFLTAVNELPDYYKHIHS